MNLLFRSGTRMLIVLFIQHFFTPTNAQTILVQPYLQNATPTSIVIMWETNVNTASTVQYGTTPSLGSSTSGTTITTLGNTVLHTVNLTGLTPATRYYYKAITGAWESSIYDFVAEPLRNSETNFNIVLMSDMQKDGSNPNIFSNLINTSLLPYIASHYGTPLSDHLQMAILPGDIVDNGPVYLQWKNDFFNPGEALWRSVPCYPAIGNHEQNSPNYFNYFNLPLNGTSGYLEHWYSHDYSNVRVLTMDSNNPYNIQAQLNWLDSMLNVSCSDTLIDFVFAQMHHPFKSELWVPGESDYSGEIVHRLETFSTTCNKPTIHFFGHTHAYSRGESRDHKHLWVNVATSGGNIDYWGEFQNRDYDEFIVSQDQYGFVMVEVTAGANPKFVLKRLSFGDEFNPGGSTETDMLSIRLNNVAPLSPYTLFPRAIDVVSPLCLTLKADAYTDPDGDEHGASQWQISTDSMNFANPIFDSWKQYADWYNEVNLQANDDLTDEEVTNLPFGASLWWRVRYRDKSLEWSQWSTSTKFHTRPLTVLTGNLVSNPGAETGINGWTATTGVIESLGALECNGINPYIGQKYFAVGALCVENAFASAYQDISVVNQSALIDAGQVMVHYGAHLADWANTDEPSFAMQFLNASAQLISGTDTTRYINATWTLKEKTIIVPSGTRFIRFIVMGTRYQGTDNDSYIDDLFLELLSGDFSCSPYAPPGPANGRIYVDADAVAYPDGESWLTAFRTLGDALLVSNVNPQIHEIWIADGTYKVTSTSMRDTSFDVKRAIRIYGGFAGNETSITQRDIINHPTTLSGEIGNPGLVSDNTYNVVHVINAIDTVLIDGLSICCGYADVAGHDTGGGLYISSSNRKPVKLHDCKLLDNHALFGSSIFNESELILDHCSVTNQPITGVAGGSILNTGIKTILTLNMSTILQYCTTCPKAIENVNGGNVKVLNAVSVEKE
ncbi:MAG: metallophosphoesterase [Saprospiraceae bacterium]|uniref:Metallophosphoesterase n=1 Tax=Candidatus Opimibacter skivensis TaxID=2982028 RepID=A0A9D7XP91_9BACT|nr:metallophosphoesterase [Candidatus Opimibacter skivensis]